MAARKIRSDRRCLKEPQIRWRTALKHGATDCHLTHQAYGSAENDLKFLKPNRRDLSNSFANSKEPDEFCHPFAPLLRLCVSGQAATPQFRLCIVLAPAAHS